MTAISLTGYVAAYSNHVGRGKVTGEALGTPSIVRNAGTDDPWSCGRLEAGVTFR